MTHMLTRYTLQMHPNGPRSPSDALSKAERWFK